MKKQSILFLCCVLVTLGILITTIVLLVKGGAGQKSVTAVVCAGVSLAVTLSAFILSLVQKPEILTIANTENDTTTAD